MKFTLLICTYNPNKEWLKEAIESAKGLFDEYILVDDGSDLPVVLEGYTNLRKDNGGLWTARNLGIYEAKGDIICLLDDDDILIPEKVKEMKKFVKENYDKADIFTHDIQFFGELNFVSDMGGNPDEILDNNQFVGVSWYKKNIWEKLGGYTYPVAEDWNFWSKAVKKELIFLKSPIVFYKCRRHAGSVSYGWTGEKFLEIRNEIRELYKQYE